MELVVDANILFSALIRSAETTQLFYSDKLILYAPEFLFTELKEHKEEILLKSGFSEDDFYLALSLLLSQVHLIPYNEFHEFIQLAKEISPDVDDIEYFALAFQLRCSFWTNDKRLKSQNSVNVISTSELLKLMS